MTKAQARIKGKEIVQVYASYTDSRVATPHWQLCSVKSVMLEANEKATVTFDIDRYWVKAVTMDGERVDPDGKITLYVRLICCTFFLQHKHIPQKF